MKIASLDLGTNSLILVVAEWDGTTFTPLFEDVQVVRLGQDLAKRGSLHPKAKRRCLKELRNFSEKIDQFEVKNVLAAGTAALRNAGDGAKFVQEIEDQLGFRFRIISGDEEASLTFKKNTVAPCGLHPRVVPGLALDHREGDNERRPLGQPGLLLTDEVSRCR